jgi:type VI secretion system protein ImpF
MLRTAEFECIVTSVHSRQPVVPSILDRLVDDSEDVIGGVANSPAQSLRELKLSVRRDLQNLLNTRWRCSSWPPDLDQLDVSLVNYGIPDFTSVNMSRASAREELREIIQEVIRKFEPRLRGVRVTLIDEQDDLERTLRYRIIAQLLVRPAPEPIEFHSRVEPGTGNIEIKRPES